MSELEKLQTRVARAILNRDFTHIAGEFAAGQGRPEHRLNIFANNTYVSLKASLKAVFPVTVLLADDRFFDYAADVFVRRHPPVEARLSRFGADFPRFLATFPPCRDHPVVAQMAAFEWAVADMMNAPQLPLAQMSDIAAITPRDGDPGIALQPNLRFSISEWPLAKVWGEHRDGTHKAMPCQVRTVTRTAITRRAGDVRFFTLEPARFAFWRALARGHPVRTALTRALARDRLFDLVAEIALLFRLELVTHVFTVEPKGILR